MGLYSHATIFNHIFYVSLWEMVLKLALLQIKFNTTIFFFLQSTIFEYKKTLFSLALQKTHFILVRSPSIHGHKSLQLFILIIMHQHHLVKSAHKSGGNPLKLFLTSVVHYIPFSPRMLLISL